MLRCKMIIAVDLRSTGRGFKSYSGQKLHNNLGQVVHTYVSIGICEDIPVIVGSSSAD